MNVSKVQGPLHLPVSNVPRRRSAVQSGSPSEQYEIVSSYAFYWNFMEETLEKRVELVSFLGEVPIYRGLKL